jgi:hypothetical protein
MWWIKPRGFDTLLLGKQTAAPGDDHRGFFVPTTRHLLSDHIRENVRRQQVPIGYYTR